MRTPSAGKAGPMFVCPAGTAAFAALAALVEIKIPNVTIEARHGLTLISSEEKRNKGDPLKNRLRLRIALSWTYDAAPSILLASCSYRLRVDACDSHFFQYALRARAARVAYVAKHANA
jgi:hypothetical protein